MTAVAARLETVGLGKSYATPVLTGVDFALAPGEVHALVGENGAGKSTLARILAGLVTPDTGTMALDGQSYAPAGRKAATAAGVRICVQELAVLDTLTVAENIHLEALPRTRLGFIDRGRLLAEARRLMALVGLEALDPDTPAARLRVGARQLVEIAAAIARPCRVLILDEPTAALSRAEVERLFVQIRRLRAEGTSVIYISHRLEEIADIADRVTVLRDGALVATCRTADTSADQLVALMVGRPVSELRPARRPSVEAADAPPALRVQGLRAGAAVRNVSFEAKRGEILGLAGLMGAGRTETLRAIFGADARDAGEVLVGDAPVSVRSPRQAVRRGMALVTEDRKAEGLLLPLALATNLTLAGLRGFAGRLGFLRLGEERAAADRWRRQLSIRSQGADQRVAELSGGNQQKLLIARWLLRGAEILLLDEPTRGIDVGARREIHRLLSELAAEGKTIVIASSDLHELMSLCDRVVVLSLGEVAATLTAAELGEEVILAAALSRHRRAAAEKEPLTQPSPRGRGEGQSEPP